MKNDVSRRYRTRVITNIIYSAIITCLVEVFFVTNLSMVARYMGNKGKMVLMVQAIEKQHTAVVLLYLILGILLFSITFMILQEPYIRYISKISDAVQNISEGNLNTVIDVIGDDEFSGMAANLNRMAADIKQLMEKERESERTKNELDIVKLLGQLLEEAYPNFVEKGLSYDLQSNVPAKTINADGNLLARLFDNLIGNAIKYGADGKRVLVQIHAESETVTVSVTNYGYVIPADELPLIFNKFYRVEQSRSSSTGGTGLGLAIAKEIVDMHGGTISVASDLNGTVFTVKLQVRFDVNKENFGNIEDEKQ